MFATFSGTSKFGHEVPPQPVLYYSPTRTQSYVGSGTTVNSLTATNLPGTMTSVTYSSPSFNFNGTSSTISVADNSLLEPGSGNWTIEVWINPSTLPASTVILGKFNNGGTSSQVSYSIRTSSGNIFSQIGDGLGNYINSTSQALNTNTWYHVIYVWTISPTKSLTTYINGSSIGSVSHTMSGILNSSNPLYLGSYNGGEYSQWFNGAIGIVRLYKTALSSSEVTTASKEHSAKYGY